MKPSLSWLFALLFLWLLLATFPLPPQTPGIGLDASWAHALNLAHAQHLIFGRDIVFTFGPLGYLFYPVPDLAGPLPVFACIWFIQGIFLAGVLLIWRALGNRLVVVISWTILAGAMLFTDLPFERMQLAFLSLAIGIVALRVSWEEIPTASLAAAGAVAGLMPLFKANEGIAAGAVFYSLLASLFFTTAIPRATLRRKIWPLALIPPAAFILGFVVVERGVTGLWSYLMGSLQLAAGYSEAMAGAGPQYQTVLALFSLLAMGVVIPLLADCRRDLLKGILPALAAGFFAFKSGVVRQDDSHAALLQIKLAVAGLFLLVCVRNVRDRRLLIAYVAASFCLGVAVHQEAFPTKSQTATDRAFLRDTSRTLSATWNLRSTWAQLTAETREQLARIRLDATVSNMVKSGTVDDVPSELDLVEANGWRWKPRPVIQSYSAYTPALDQLNARHLASPESADHILLQWQDIDDRHPLLDDAASWRALFDHYDVDLARSDLLVLKRREAGRYLAPQPIGSLTTAWRSEIALPEPNPSGFIMLRAEIHKSLYGILQGMLFRNSATYVNAAYLSGKHWRWRATRANLADGAFIGYLPEKLNQVLPYFGKPGDGPQDRVVSIRFETTGPLEYSSAIRLAWYFVAFRPGNAEHEAVPAAGASANFLHAETRGFIDTVNDQPLSAAPVQAAANRPITLSGWVVDEPAHLAAAAVYIDVDGQLFPTEYGIPRHDVVESLKEPGYENCGFKSQFQAGPGSHKVMLRVVNAAGTGYYAGPSFLLNVK